MSIKNKSNIIFNDRFCSYTTTIHIQLKIIISIIFMKIKFNQQTTLILEKFSLPEICKKSVHIKKNSIKYLLIKGREKSWILIGMFNKKKVLTGFVFNEID